MSAGLLIVRLVFGLLMAAHGSQKLFGWFGGRGLRGVVGGFESLGFRPGLFFAAVAAGAEVASGLLVAIGLLGPVGPALMLAVMIVAAISAHWKHGVFAASNGIEIPLLYAAFAAALTLTGLGSYSLDMLLGLEQMWTPELKWSALGVGVIGGVANLFLRTPARAVTPA